MVTFATGPSILTAGQDHSNHDALLPGPDPRGPTIQDQEHVGLLYDHDGQDDDDLDPYHIQGTLRKLQDTPNVRWPEKLKFMEKPTKKFVGFLNPPVIGAILALIFGVRNSFIYHATHGVPNHLDVDGWAAAQRVPRERRRVLCVHHIGRQKPRRPLVCVSGSFCNRLLLTPCVASVALQMFTVGAQLALVPTAHPGVKPTSFVLLVRFVIMPLISIGFVWATANRGLYADDPLVW